MKPLYSFSLPLLCYWSFFLQFVMLIFQRDDVLLALACLELLLICYFFENWADDHEIAFVLKVFCFNSSRAAAAGKNGRCFITYKTRPIFVFFRAGHDHCSSNSLHIGNRETTENFGRKFVFETPSTRSPKDDGMDQKIFTPWMLFFLVPPFHTMRAFLRCRMVRKCTKPLSCEKIPLPGWS